jgi:hypothetical protein
VTTHQHGDPVVSIPDDHLRELAASGALCQECGGLCVGTVDVGIHALATGVPLPWCACPECPVCRPFRESISAYAVPPTTEEP